MGIKNILNKIECIVCNSTDTKLMYKLLYGDVLVCMTCKTAFTYFQNKEKFYEANSKWNESDRLKSQIYNIPESRRIALSRLKLLKEYSTQKKLVEFGPNTGEFLYVASMQDFQVTGVDQFPAVLNLNKPKKMNFIKSNAEELEIKEKFDIVAAFHLFEHLERPKDFLEKARNMLYENGILFLEVPNYGSLSRIIQKEKWSMFYEYHLTHFDRNSLPFLLTKNGFKILKIRTIQPLSLMLDSYYLPIRHFIWSLLKKKFNHQTTVMSSVEISDKNNEVVAMSLEEENKINTGIKSKISRLESWIKRMLALPLFPYAYLVSKVGYGDMLQIIAKKDVKEVNK